MPPLVRTAAGPAVSGALAAPRAWLAFESAADAVPPAAFAAVSADLDLLLAPFAVFVAFFALFSAFLATLSGLGAPTAGPTSETDRKAAQTATAIAAPRRCLILVNISTSLVG
jgi:hypothetical protein